MFFAVQKSRYFKRSHHSIRSMCYVNTRIKMSSLNLQTRTNVEKSVNFRDGQFASLRFSLVYPRMHLRIYLTESGSLSLLFNCDCTVINSSYFMGLFRFGNNWLRGKISLRININATDLTVRIYVGRNSIFREYDIVLSLLFPLLLFHLLQPLNPAKTSFGILVSDW